MNARTVRERLYGEAAEAAGMSRNRMRKAVDAFLKALKAALKAGERVEMRRFGTFRPRTWKGRVVVTPKTKRVVHAKKSRTVSFIPGKELGGMRGGAYNR